jgi:hypothetical protein
MEQPQISRLLRTLTPSDAQLLLSYLIWPRECPDPRLIDQFVREGGLARGAAHPSNKSDVPHSPLDQT